MWTCGPIQLPNFLLQNHLYTIMSSFVFDPLSLLAFAASGDVDDYFQRITGDSQQQMWNGHHEKESAPPSPFSLSSLGTPDVKPYSSSYDNFGAMPPSPFSLSDLGSSPDVTPYSASYDDYLGAMPPMLPSGFQLNEEIHNSPNAGIYQDEYGSLPDAAPEIQVNADFAAPFSPQDLLAYMNLTCAPTPPSTPTPTANPFQGYQQNWIPSAPEKRAFILPFNDPLTLGQSHDFMPTNQATCAAQSKKDKITRRAHQRQSTGQYKFVYCQPIAEKNSSTTRVLSCSVSQRKLVNSSGKPRIKIIYADSDGTEKALYFRSCVTKPRALCQWNGCREEVWTDRKSIREHMEQAHGVNWIPKDRVNCRWPGCQNNVLIDSLFRHITNTHMHVVRASCLHCGEEYSRIDCRSRHSPKCLLRRADF